MPRAIVPAVVLLAALAAPALADPALGGTVDGVGEASALTVYKYGATSFEGGFYRYNLLCTACFVNLTVSNGTVTVSQDGEQFAITSGTWQFREFVGTFSYTPRNLDPVTFRIEGTARVEQVS